MSTIPADPAHDRRCDHCGLTVPAGRAGTAGFQFCCAGCEGAWALLHSCGLEQYYRLPERRSAPVAPGERGFESFDHPSFHAHHVRTGPAGSLETDLFLEGIHCASCLWLIERVPRLVPGMLAAELDVPHARVRVRWDAGATRLSEIARVLDALGYRPHPFRGRRADEERRAAERAMLGRIGVAGAIAANVMMIALALYAGWFGDMDPGTERYFRWASLLLTLPALVFPGSVFFRSAWAALSARTLHMDVPIAVALAAGFARGAYNTVRDAGPVYFDGVAMLVFLLLVGRFLQQRAQRAAADASDLLHALAPSRARVIGDAGAHEVPIDGLLPGMTIEIRPGETLPADGTVLTGESSLDLSLLTGESRPVSAGPGAEVHAGTLNRTGPLRVRVDRAGESTRLARLLREVESGAARRAPVVRTADRLAGAFVAVVLALAAITGLAWLARDAAAAVDHAIALLIVTCPCALALATPLAVTSAIGRAARAGILIRGGDALETLGRPGHMVLDKTGTLTVGRPTLVAFDGPDDCRRGVLALERDAVHPVARAFREAWPGLDVPEAVGVRHEIGGGLSGIVEGRRVVVGSPAFVARHLEPEPGDGAAIPRDPGPSRPDVAAPPRGTPVWIAVDGRRVAVAGFDDAIRPEAAEVLARLRSLGWTLELLSGDDPGLVDEIGARLGFAAHERRGAASPEDKRRVVEAAARRGRVVMVGDGVNDAAAMACASAGVGIHGGAEASLAVADVHLAGDGLRSLVALVEGSRRTLGVIRRGLAFSLGYNAIGAALAAAGLVHPIVAAILMPASSLTVVLAAYRSRTFGAPTSRRATEPAESPARRAGAPAEVTS